MSEVVERSMSLPGSCGFYLKLVLGFFAEKPGGRVRIGGSGCISMNLKMISGCGKYYIEANIDKSLLRWICPIMAIILSLS